MAVNALLRLSARGEALVAELLRLADHIPPLFSLQEKAEQKAAEQLIDAVCDVLEKVVPGPAASPEPSGSCPPALCPGAAPLCTRRRGPRMSMHSHLRAALGPTLTRARTNAHSCSDHLA